MEYLEHEVFKLTKSKIKEDNYWKYYRSFTYRKHHFFDIKQGKKDKKYWEYKVKKPNGKISRKTRYTNNITNFKHNVKSDLKN